MKSIEIVRFDHVLWGWATLTNNKILFNFSYTRIEDIACQAIRSFYLLLSTHIWRWRTIVVATANMHSKLRLEFIAHTHGKQTNDFTPYIRTHMRHRRHRGSCLVDKYTAHAQMCNTHSQVAAEHLLVFVEYSRKGKYVPADVSNFIKMKCLFVQRFRTWRNE